MSLWIVTMIFILGLAALEIARNEMRKSRLGKDANCAFYLAEAGIEFVRGVAWAKSQAVVNSSSPRGITTPTLTFAQLAGHCGCTKVSDTEYRSSGAVPLKDEQGNVMGYFSLILICSEDAVGSLENPPPESEALPSGNFWLPALVVESTGFLGTDLSHPVATRKVVADLKPLPPPVLSSCRMPPKQFFLKPDYSIRIDVNPDEIKPYLPDYGVPSYEVISFRDTSAVKSDMWNCDNSTEDPLVYPPLSSGPDVSPPEPYWRVP